MPSYTTPKPIDIAIDISVGGLEIIASDRADTVVTVAPTNPAREQDRKGADATKVEFDGERLTIVGPRPRVAVFGPNESIDVRLEVPTASRLTADVSLGGVAATGRLGATRIKKPLGSVSLEATGDLWLRNAQGGVTVGIAEGSVEATVDHGQVRIGTVTGDATVKASHGALSVEHVWGDLEAKLSYGDLEVGRADASVTAKTAHGNLRIGEVSAGAVEVETGLGEVAVGVRDGVAAWLDLSSKVGHVRSDLAGDAAPATGEPSVSVRARTQVGDIKVRRAG